MVMLEAYFDESGIHDGASICIIAGYFAGRTRWRQFEIDWKKMLYRFKVPMHEFHAKDIFPERRGFFSRHWKGNHREFLTAIADTIACHDRIHPICAAIAVEDFKSFPEIHRKFFTGANVNAHGRITSSGSPNKPYFVPFQKCIVRCCEYATKGSKTNFFFGLDRSFYEYATVLFKQISESELRPELGHDWKERLGSPSFPLAKETPQLQAADFFAALTYHYVQVAKDAIAISQPPPAPPLLAMCIKNARNITEDFLFMNRETLEGDLRVSTELSKMLKERAASST